MPLQNPMIESQTNTSFKKIAFDLILVVAVSFVAQATHFSYQQGRAVISGDSAQYVASAQAVLEADKTPHFEMRKPGYILFLAGVAYALGNMGWAAVACNHALLGLLPVIAYGFGFHLRGRGTGWVAALLVLVRLQGEYRADRIMSEALYVVLFSSAILLFVMALSSRRVNRLMIGAGLCMGLAWFTRSAATPIVLVCMILIFVHHRSSLRRAILVSCCFLIPVLAFVVVECSLNRAFAGQFRPSNGTSGATVLLRARNFQGFEWPDTPEAKQVIELLPQRDPHDAYVAQLLDVWVARYHAVHDLGMNEWEYDGLMREVGLHMLRDNLGPYTKSSLRIAFDHLLRKPDGQSLSPVPRHRLADPLIHPSAIHDPEAIEYWFAYWGLPHLSIQDSVTLVDEMKVAAAQQAPFGDGQAWKALRYWKTKPLVANPLTGLTWISGLWPGFALLGFSFFGLRGRTCAFLALAYLVDALFIGFLTPTTARIQFGWIVLDTVLAAALTVGVVGLLAPRCRKMIRGLRHARGKPSSVGDESSLPARS